ncbi:MAG: histidine phosphatase family protein [Acaryochloridaceae cyanobacterium SU_2_1]|nr:histidine phosphatase family protein [Acaryochloridaceae cyanobacterium SU_2_1]
MNNRLAFLNPVASTRVILVRHGRSTYNEQGRYQGSSDEALLTPKGRQDAFQTGLALGDLSDAALYTSPLRRAQQTTQEILAALQSDLPCPIPVCPHPDLKEIDLPQWAGRPYTEVRETLADQYRCWIEHPHEFEMERRHPVRDLYAQAQRFWQEVLPRHRGKTLVVVSHGGTIRALLSTALGIDCRYFHSLQQSNGGISQLSFQSGRANLEIMNDTRHLGETLPKLKAGKQGVRLLLVPDDSPNLQALQAQLDGMEIGFSVSNGEPAHGIAQRLLTRHPLTVQLQSDRTDLSHLWLRILNSRQHSSQRDDGIVTGLVIAQPTVVQDMLNHVIGGQPGMLALTAGGINVVHYAQTQTLPILQALNFAKSADSRGGLIPCAS